jgi:hypothetical protein
MMMNPPVDSGVPDSGTPATATLTATGALDGGVTVPAPIVGYDATGGTSTFTMPMQSSGPFLADINMAFGGAPMSMAYDKTSTGFTCDVTVTSGTSSGDTWTALINKPAKGADKGTCSLSLSSETVGPQGYVVHGTLAITAPFAQGQSTGTVNLTGTF